MGGKEKTVTHPRLQSKAKSLTDCGAYLQERLGRIFLCSYGVANFCGRWGIFGLGADSGVDCFGGSHAKSSPEDSFPFGVSLMEGNFVAFRPFADGVTTAVLTGFLLLPP